MVGWLSSPRRRRRLAWTVLPLLSVAGAVGALIAFGGHSRTIEPDLRLTGEAQVYRAPTEVKLTRAQRRAADRTLHEFVAAAVLREDPAAAWELASQELRSGITRSQWDRGDMPVQPYPARTDRLSWRLLKAYSDHLELDVLLFPQRGANVGPMSFAVELKPANDRWAVSYWYPRTTLAGGATEKPGKTAAPQPTPPPPDTTTGRLGHAFFLVPIAIFSLIVLVPLVFFAATWYRSRRAYRRYARRS
jgi:hypothetical protein